MTYMTKKIIYSPFYRTKDQFIASTLYSFGEKLDSTEWVGNECYFLFENETKCKELAQKYYSGELKVNPRILFDSFKVIKSILFNN